MGIGADQSACRNKSCDCHPLIMKIWKRKALGWLLAAISIGVVIAGAAFWMISLRSRAAASECWENIALINGGKQTWALESDSGPEAKPTWEDIYSCHAVASREGGCTLGASHLVAPRPLPVPPQDLATAQRTG